jgi:hypothetical protein
VAVVSGESIGTVEVTPSRIPVYFQSKPKRLYKIGPANFNFRGTTADEANDELLWDAQNDPRNEWREVPSVSTVLNTLKTPLEWWGMRIGIEGCVELCNRGELSMSGPVRNTRLAEQIEAKLIEHELTVNHVSGRAQERGQAVHDALETWAKTGHMPQPDIYPDEERGYVEGLVAFLKDIPSAETIGVEVMVASSVHGFAGRYDIRIRTHQPQQIVKHYTPVRGNQYATLVPGLYLWDLKTGKGVYPNKHFPQLEGYEGASIESGYEPTDGRGIIHVSADGKHKLVRSPTNYQHFLSVLEVWKAEQNMKQKKAA